MLVESSFSSSAETSLLNVSEYQDPYAAYDWVSLAETNQMIHKFPKQSQVSFLEAVPFPDAMNLGESKHPKLQVSCPEKCVMCKGSEKSLTSLVYSRRKRSVKPGGTAENNKKQDDSLDDPGESTKRKDRFDNCLVYTRKKRSRKSGCNFTGETTIMGDGLDNAFVSEHDCGETKRRGDRFDNCLVYRRKKGRVKSDSCSCSEHVSGETKIPNDQADSSAYGYDGAFTGLSSGHSVISRGTFTGHDPRETKKNGDQLSVVSSHALSVPQKYSNIVSHVEQESGALEVIDNSQVTEATYSSNGTNDSCSSLNSSTDIAAGPSKTRKDEATVCNSSDVGVSEADTDGSSSPFRPCKHCNKPDTVEKMLICDIYEE